MNWYKLAQQENNWKITKMVSALGMSAILSLLAISGMNMPALAEQYQENPQQVTQQVQQVQQSSKLVKETPIMQVEEPVINEAPQKGVMTEEKMKEHFKDEYEVILNAAKRNNLDPQDYDLLFSIRKSENGGKGREFGIIHPKADAEMKKRPNDTLDIQAGWAASTIRKNRARWEEAGKPGDFITFLGNRYAPKGVANDPTNLNKNWIQNVSDWEERI